MNSAGENGEWYGAIKTGFGPLMPRIPFLFREKGQKYGVGRKIDLQKDLSAKHLSAIRLTRAR
jgi:hypothetical protein